MKAVCFIALLVAACASSKPGTPARSGDAAKVYALVLGHAHFDHPPHTPTDRNTVVVTPSIQLPDHVWPPFGVPSSQTLRWVQRDMPGLEESTLRAFEEAAPQHVTVAGEFPFPVVAQDQVIDYARERQWLYPNTIHLSAVAFNEVHTQALVYRTTAVAGYLVLAYHDGSQWKIQDFMQLWIA